MERTLADITDREVEIIMTIALGKTTGQAARALGLSEFTVKSHLQRIAQATESRNTPHSLDILIAAERIRPLPAIGLRRLSYAGKTILRDIANGWENPQIAHRQDLTLGQVQYAVKGIFRDLEADNRTQAVLRGYQTGNLIIR